MCKRLLSVLALLWLFSPEIFAQLYGTSVTTKEMDLCNCEFGDVVVPNFSTAIAADYDENIYYANGVNLFFYDVDAGSATQVGTLPFPAGGMVYSADGLVYAVVGFTGPQTLVVYDPATGSLTVLGSLPAGATSSGGDLFFFGGELYFTTVFNGVFSIMHVPIGNPSAATVMFSYPNLQAMAGAATLLVNGVETVYITALQTGTGGTGSSIYSVDMLSGSTTLVCPNFAGNDMAAAPDAILLPCCQNDAGSLVENEPLEFCIDENAQLTHNGEEILDANSDLFFILVTDTTTTLPTSVLSVNGSPTFAFNPTTMSAGVYYYVAAVAAPVLNGAPDWASSCFDRSYYVPVRWHPLPTLAILSQSAPLCVGDCAEVEVALTGIFPLNLSWTSDLAPPNAAGTWTASSSPATFSICPPPGNNFPPGNFGFQFTSVSDGVCACP